MNEIVQKIFQGIVEGQQNTLEALDAAGKLPANLIAADGYAPDASRAGARAKSLIP